MLKSLFAAVAALALTSGLAMAQDQETTTHERTTVQNPDGSQSVQASKSKTRTDDFGNQSTQKKSFSKTEGVNGSEESRSREEHNADGSSSSSRETTVTSH